VYLDWRNGFDIFGKTTSAMVLQDVGQDDYDSYHEPGEWGMDILKVGDALGIGGYGYWDGDKAIRVADVAQRSVRIYESGPIYSLLEILYEGWAVDNMATDLRALLSMSAGSRLVHVRLKMTDVLDNIAIGLVKHPGVSIIHGDVEITGRAWTYVATWGMQTLSDDKLGMVLLFRKGDRKKQTEDEHSLVSVMRSASGELDYYFGAAWEQEVGGITTEAEFVEYIENEAERLTMPLRIRIQTARSAVAKSEALNAETALGWSIKLADAELVRLSDSLSLGNIDRFSKRPSKWSYSTGFLAQAMDDLSSATGDTRYAKFAKETIDSFLPADGGIATYDATEYNIDSVNSAKMLLRYSDRENDPKYREAAKLIRAQLESHPRTGNGAFWHKQRYPSQLWLDGVYMGMPFLAQYSQLYEDGAHIDDAVNEVLIVHQQLRDPATGLYFHAWDESKQQSWADPESGLSSYAWSRGMGWYAMALVDILDFVPEDRLDTRSAVIGIIRNFADALLAARSTEGVWYQIADMHDAPGNYLEASGSSMFIYMMAKAINKGYLDANYADTVLDAYVSLVREFVVVETDDSISLNNVCRVAGLGFGRDGSYRYYMSEPVVSNDPKGVAPFIMAGIQVSKMLASQPDV